MSGLESIKTWTDLNIDFSLEDNSLDLYDKIDEIFQNDGRSNLDNILRGEKPQFMEFLEMRIKENRDIPRFEDLAEDEQQEILDKEELDESLIEPEKIEVEPIPEPIFDETPPPSEPIYVKESIFPEKKVTIKEILRRKITKPLAKFFRKLFGR